MYVGAWCGAWCVVRGAWCVVRGAWCRTYLGKRHHAPVKPHASTHLLPALNKLKHVLACRYCILWSHSQLLFGIALDMLSIENYVEENSDVNRRYARILLCSATLCTPPIY